MSKKEPAARGKPRAKLVGLARGIEGKSTGVHNRSAEYGMQLFFEAVFFLRESKSNKTG
jgi:hypothetical protein